MKEIYRLRPAERAIWLVGEPDGAALRMAGLKGDLDAEWPPTTASYAAAPDVAGVSYDIPWVSESTIALRSTRSTFARELAPYGVFLPVDAPDARFWLFDCSVILDGALLPGTEGEWLADGFRMFQLRKAVFDPAVVDGHPIFRLRELRTEIFVDHSIRLALTSAGLTGLEFDKIWSA